MTYLSLDYSELEYFAFHAVFRAKSLKFFIFFLSYRKRPKDNKAKIG